MPVRELHAMLIHAAVARAGQFRRCDVVAEDAGLPAENRLRIQTVAAAEVQHRRRKIQRGERFRLDAAPERHRRRKPIATQEIRKIVIVFEDAQIVGHGVGLSHFNALTHHRRCTF